jgi:hypothetical protein
MRRLLLIVLTLAIGLTVFSASSAPRTKVDRNVRAADATVEKEARKAKKAKKVFRKAVRQYKSANVTTAGLGDLCAIGVIPGPATGFNIRLGLFNVAPSGLNYGIIDPFRAFGGRSLLLESVFSTAPPAGGTLDVLYPPTGTSGKGPAVLGFTSFDQFESVSFNMDPDTYDDPAFGVTVQDMDGTVIELVYAGELRCAGTLQFNAGLNASVAVITQTFP